MADSDPFLFVSHVSEDRVAALEIVGELERRGVPCWIAPRNVEPGHPFDDEIVAALDRCRAMLLIFSEHCNESEYIRREVTVAGENRKIIIPFLQPFTATPSKTLTESLTSGSFTIMLKIKGLTDEAKQTNTGLSGTLGMFIF